MNELESLVKSIEIKKTLATSEVGNNPATYNVRLGKIKRAKIDLEELYLEYRKEVQRRALFIIVTGTQADKFADIAEEEFFCYQMNSNSFYEDIVADINPRLYTNTIATPSLFDMIGGIFEEKAMAIGVIGYPALLFELKYKKKLTNKEDLVSLLKTAFNDKVGAEMLGLDAIEKISNIAINQDDEEKKILNKFPIVMVTKDETLVKDLAQGLKFTGQGVHIIGAGTVKDKDVSDNCTLKVKTINKTSVEKGLVKINEL